MFGLKRTSELDRLRSVYAEQSDGELLRLHENRGDLTDAARQALDETMQQRGLEPGKAETGDASGLPHGERKDDASRAEMMDEVELWFFRDTYQLGNLIRLLENSGIGFRLQEHTESTGTGLRERRENTGVQIFVEQLRKSEARRLLRQVLFAAGLDQEEPPPLALTPPSGLELLLTCSRKDALGIVHSLAQAGISFYWRDGREDNEVPGEDGIALEVHTTQRERADKVVEAWMASLPPGDEEDAEAQA